MNITSTLSITKDFQSNSQHIPLLNQISTELLKSDKIVNIDVSNNELILTGNDAGDSADVTSTMSSLRVVSTIDTLTEAAKIVEWLSREVIKSDIITNIESSEALDNINLYLEINISSPTSPLHTDLSTDDWRAKITSSNTYDNTQYQGYQAFNDLTNNTNRWVSKANTQDDYTTSVIEKIMPILTFQDSANWGVTAHHAVNLDTTGKSSITLELFVGGRYVTMLSGIINGFIGTNNGNLVAKGHSDMYGIRIGNTLSIRKPSSFIVRGSGFGQVNSSYVSSSNHDLTITIEGYPTKTFKIGQSPGGYSTESALANAVAETFSAENRLTAEVVNYQSVIFTKESTEEFTIDTNNMDGSVLEWTDQITAGVTVNKTLTGNWLQIDIGEVVILDHFNIYNGDYSNDYARIRKADVLTSLTGEDGTWKSIYQIRTISNPGNIGLVTYNVDDANKIEGRYYRIVIMKSWDTTISGGYNEHVAIDEWNLFGTKFPSPTQFPLRFIGDDVGNTFSITSSLINNIDQGVKERPDEIISQMSNEVLKSEKIARTLFNNVNNLPMIGINIPNNDETVEFHIFSNTTNGSQTFTDRTLNNHIVYNYGNATTLYNRSA